MTIANLGLAVDSSSVVAATPALEKMTAASAQAEAAATRLGAASRTEASGTATATAAAKMHTAALQAQAAAARMVANDTRMLGFQLNDIAVSLASGMNPAMVAMQQGSQIAQMGLRNVAVAGASIVRSFAPVLAIVGAVSLAIGAMTTEINRNEKEQVSWGNVALATWQLATEKIVEFFQPVISTLGGWWDLAAPMILQGINNVIGAFVFAYDAIKLSWGMLPSAIGDLVYQGAQSVVDGVIWMLREAVSTINGFINQINALLPEQMRMGGLGSPNNVIPDFKIDNPFAGYADNFATEMGIAAEGAFGNDWVGSALDAIGSRARKIAASSGEDDGTKGTKKAIRSIGDEFEKLQGKVYGVREAITGVFGDMGSVIADSFRKGGNVAMNILDGILGKVANVGESLMNAGLNGLLNMGLNALTGALTGSMTGFSYGPNVFSDPWGGLRANGGPVEAGKAYIVGEKRPEVFVPRSNGSILPSVPNGMTVNISISGSKQDAAAIANALMPQMRQMIVQYQKNPDRG